MTFDRKTINAGKQVKEKWRMIVEESYKDSGYSDCEYCRLYRKDHLHFGSENKVTCTGCPIKFFTGADTCNITPYPDFYYAHYSIEKTQYAKDMRRLVDEIFVRSLLFLNFRKEEK